LTAVNLSLFILQHYGMHKVKIAYTVNINYRIDATLYTLETWIISGM